MPTLQQPVVLKESPIKKASPSKSRIQLDPVDEAAASPVVASVRHDSLAQTNSVTFNDAAARVLMPSTARMKPSISAPELRQVSKRSGPAPTPYVAPSMPSPPPWLALNPLPPLVEMARIRDASVDVSYLTDRTSWRERAVAYLEGDGKMVSGLSADSEHFRVEPAGRHGALVRKRSDELVEHAVDPSNPHGWYIDVFDKPLPAGRRDAVLLLRWLNDIDAAVGAAPSEGDVSLTASPPLSRERVEQYSAAFEEAVKQVSVGCIERGQVLARVWKRLSTSLSGFLDCEATLRRELSVLRVRHEKEIDRVAHLAQEKGDLIDRLSAAEANAKWSAASIRIRRYQDTVKWRTALAMLAREKDKLAAQLEELRMVNQEAGYQAMLRQSEDDDDQLALGGSDGDGQGGRSSHGGGGGSGGEGGGEDGGGGGHGGGGRDGNGTDGIGGSGVDGDAEDSKGGLRLGKTGVDDLISGSLKSLPMGSAGMLEDSVQSIASKVAPSMLAMGKMTIAAVGLSSRQRRKIAQQQAEEKVVDGLLSTALEEIEDDLARSRSDITSANFQAKEMAKLASDLKSKNDELASLRAQLRSARDEVDGLQSRFAASEAGDDVRAATDEARRNANAAAEDVQRLSEGALRQADERAEEVRRQAEEAARHVEKAQREAEAKVEEAERRRLGNEVNTERRRAENVDAEQRRLADEAEQRRLGDESKRERWGQLRKPEMASSATQTEEAQSERASKASSKPGSRPASKPARESVSSNQSRPSTQASEPSLGGGNMVLKPRTQKVKLGDDLEFGLLTLKQTSKCMHDIFSWRQGRAVDELADGDGLRETFEDYFHDKYALHLASLDRFACRLF